MLQTPIFETTPVICNSSVPWDQTHVLSVVGAKLFYLSYRNICKSVSFVLDL